MGKVKTVTKKGGGELLPSCYTWTEVVSCDVSFSLRKTLWLITVTGPSHMLMNIHLKLLQWHSYAYMWVFHSLQADCFVPKWTLADRDRRAFHWTPRVGHCRDHLQWPLVVLGGPLTALLLCCCFVWKEAPVEWLCDGMNGTAEGQHRAAQRHQ